MTTKEKKHEGNLYKKTAYLYDADSRPLVKDDFSFYLDYARQTEGKILELACGTGRITIPLATQGHWILGIDLSDEMLKVMEEKTYKIAPFLLGPLHFMTGDMTKFKVDWRFSLVIIPIRGFQALLEEEQQNACLQNVVHHMEPDGRFIITFMKPIPDIEKNWVSPEEHFDWEGEAPLKGQKVKRYSKRTAIDPERQIVSVELTYHVKPRFESEYITSEELHLKYYYPEQIEKMLDANGFKIEDKFGYYDRCPIHKNSELIYVCKLK